MDSILDLLFGLWRFSDEAAALVDFMKETWVMEPTKTYNNPA